MISHDQFDTFGAGIPASEISLSSFVIGVAGKANSGKDTFYKFLQAELRKAHHVGLKESFAYALKAGYSAMFGIPMDLLDDPEFKEQINPYTGTTHRRELQLLGTEHYRQRTNNMDVWIQLLAKRLTKVYNFSANWSERPIFIITDCRFDNESVFCQNNGIVVKIDRGDTNPVIDNATHASEAGLSTDTKYVIKNTGTLEDYQKAVQKFVWNDLLPLINSYTSCEKK
ncbi:MAG TPA: hypothetical protein VFM18_14065 [Methanosarcina sp.]|nr:hypothetical protein [Methanosarcina sp.]